jgi:VanZ family protein
MPAILWAACIYLASSMPSGRIQWWLFHRFDKVIHLTIFFVFGLLVYRGLHRWSDPRKFSHKRVFLMLMIVLGYGLFDEIHQGNTPGRSVDLGDFLADVAGGVLAGGVIIARNFMRERRPDAG